MKPLTSNEKFLFIEHVKSLGDAQKAARQARLNYDRVVENLEQDSQFSREFQLALNQYQDTSDLVLSNQARVAQRQFLFGEMERVSRTIMTTIYPDGTEMITETVKRSPVGVPLELVRDQLGLGISELQAVAALARVGWLPNWLATEIKSKILACNDNEIKMLFQGILPKPADAAQLKPVGLSPEDQEVIKAQVLGISDRLQSEATQEQRDAYEYNQDFKKEYGLVEDR